MDLNALEYTRQHYDRHAGQHKNSTQALKERASGPSAPLKRFHNEIKRKLIERFAFGTDRLLDFACGRGGDIWKWMDCKIKYVKGLDLSPGEIKEARQRYTEASAKRTSTHGSVDTICEFQDTPSLGLSEWKDSEPYDVLTCMFAIHYFFVSEQALQQFMHNVSINLKPGGYFIGTVPDGKKVNECIIAGKVYNTPMLRIEAHWQGQPKPFGSPYICAIGDTVTGAEKDTVGSYEYLVYTNVLVAVAKQHGLTPVLDYGDPALEDALFKPEDRGKPLKHFKPHFPGSDESLEWASQLFGAFVFQKTGTGRVGPVQPPRGAIAPEKQEQQQQQRLEKRDDGGVDVDQPQTKKRKVERIDGPAGKDIDGGKQEQQEEGVDGADDSKAEAR